MEVFVWETSYLLGGGQQMSLLVAKMLKERFNVKFLIPQKGPLSAELDKEGIPYICCGNQTLPLGIKKKAVLLKYCWLSLKSMMMFLRVYRIHKPDILYVPGPSALPWGAICGVLIRRPVIWHLHHIFEDSGTIRLLNFFSNWPSIKRIISISDCVRSQLSSELIKNKFVRLYNPVDLLKYKDGNACKIYKELSLNSGGQIIIGHIGILQPSKRQDFVIQVVAEMLKRGCAVHALLVGSARAETMDYEKHLHEMVADLNLKENIHFLGQRVDIPDILAAVDVVIIPSLEGLSLVGLEALAAGKPIVCNGVGGGRELVEVSKGGVCYKNSVVNAVNAILEALTPKLRPELIRNAVGFIEDQSYENYRKQILGQFEQVLTQCN